MCTPAHTNTLIYSDTYAHTRVCTHKHMDTLTHMHAHRCVTHEHVSMHTCIHTCTQFTHLHTCTHIYVCVYTCTHTCLHTHAYICICIYIYMRTGIYILVHTHIHTHKHVYICMYNTYTHICAHTFKCCTIMFWPAMYHMYDHGNGTEKFLSSSDSHRVQPSACLVCLGCCGMHPTVLPILCGPAPTTEQCPVLSSDTGWQWDCCAY